MTLKPTTLTPRKTAMAARVICVVGITVFVSPRSSFAAEIAVDWDIQVFAQELENTSDYSNPNVPPPAEFDDNDHDQSTVVNPKTDFENFNEPPVSETYNYFGDGEADASLSEATGKAMVGKLSSGIIAIASASRTKKFGHDSVATISAAVSPSWSDNILLVTGTTGLVDINAKVVLEGEHGCNAQGSAPNVANCSVHAAVFAFENEKTEIGLVQDAENPAENPPFVYHDPNPSRQVISTKIKVRPGVNFPFSVQLSNEAGINLESYSGEDPPGNVGGAVTSEFNDTMLWDGIESVTDDATGQPIENWTITSESGFDYAKPFPVSEPASASLLIVSLAAFAGAPRRPPRGATERESESQKSASQFRPLSGRVPFCYLIAHCCVKLS